MESLSTKADAAFDEYRISLDALVEILSYLPAKEVFKLGLVCRSFHQLTTDPYFLIRQARRARADSGVFVQSRAGHQDFISLDPHSAVPKKGLEFLHGTAKNILASAEGLVFLQNEAEELSGFGRVYNLARHTSSFLPPPPPGVEFCLPPKASVAVWFDGMSSDYKLVCITPGKEWGQLLECTIYCSKAEAWTAPKMIHGGSRNLRFDCPAVVCDDGTAFWISSCGCGWMVEPYIVAFHIEEERSEIISLPEEMMGRSNNTDIRIAKWDGKSLCLVHYYCGRSSSTFTVWVMTWSYGRTPVWQKIRGMRLKLTRRIVNKETPVIQSFILVNGDTLVFTTSDHIYSFSFRENKLKKLRSNRNLPCGFYSTLIPYANALRPCGRWESKEIEIR